jgi:hypothetical protein
VKKTDGSHPESDKLSSNLQTSMFIQYLIYHSIQQRKVMKTNKLVKTVLAVALFFMVQSVTFAAGRSNRVSENENIPVVNFFSADTILVVVPANGCMSTEETALIENTVFWHINHYRPVYVYKKESELTKTDKKKHILFYGCFSDFNSREFIQLPVHKIKNGFRVNKKRYDKAEDSFFFVNNQATRMYLCKNSPTASHQFFAIGGTPYPLHVFSDNQLVLTGNF